MEGKAWRRPVPQSRSRAVGPFRKTFRHRIKPQWERVLDVAGRQLVGHARRSCVPGFVATVNATAE